MRTINRNTRFRKDYKRVNKGPHRSTLEFDLRAILALLANDLPLPIQLRDHALTGEWKDFRDLHLKPDLVLIYSKPDTETLELVRLGSHSELGL